MRNKWIAVNNDNVVEPSRERQQQTMRNGKNCSVFERENKE